MLRLRWNVFVAIGILNATAAFGQDTQAASARYKALACPRPTVGTTWADREARRRQSGSGSLLVVARSR